MHKPLMGKILRITRFSQHVCGVVLLLWLGLIGNVAAQLTADEMAIGELAADELGLAPDELALSEQDRESVEARLQEITTNIAALREQRSLQNEQLDQLFDGLAELEQRLQQTRELIIDNRAALAVSNTELLELEQQEQLSSAALQQQQQQLDQQLIAAYQLGRQSRLKLLLNLESATDLTRMLAYHERFSEQRAGLIEGINNELQVLAGIREGILQRQVQIENLNQQHTAELDNLAMQQQQRQSLVADIREELEDIDISIAELQLNQQQLETLLANLQDLFADIPDELAAQPFAELKGQLVWPIKNTNPRISGRFGQSRAAGVDWTGIFIDVAEGQAVHSVARGRVAFADWLRGFGWLIIIDHNDGYMSLYGNNSQLLQEVGNWVAPGEQVAVSGAGFGSELRSGVYFELRQDGRAYNPEPWLVNP